jgi:flavin-dependent dehydrogenase
MSLVEVGVIRPPRDSYELVILGGGLAGLTLSIQIKRRRPQTSIAVLEKREGPAPLAAFKVGESTVGGGAHYLADVIGMVDHLRGEQNIKCGLRFFPPSSDNSDITERIELGPPAYPRDHTTYQIDRGLFENRLASRARTLGVDVVAGARVKEIELGDPHRVSYDIFGRQRTVASRWVVDAAGRASLLKRQLGLALDSGHHINSAWFRLAGGLDLEQWGAADPEWMSFMTKSGIRRFSTNHLLGRGYWVWLIQLATGPISIGVCADPRSHPFEEISSFDSMLDWLRRHEPQLAAEVEGRVGDVEDFLRVEDFSYAVAQQCSQDRWALVGEAAAFADPFFSPGSDFIGLSNTLTTELVVRDLEDADIAEHVEYFNSLYKRTFESIVSRYRDTYAVFGDPWVVVGVLQWIFMENHNGFVFLMNLGRIADLEFMKSVDHLLDRIYALNMRAHQLCRAWHDLIDMNESRRPRQQLLILKPVMKPLIGPDESAPSDELIRAELARQVREAEAFLVALFAQAVQDVPGNLPALDGPMNPLAVGLDPSRWEADGLFGGQGPTVDEARAICEGIDAVWDSTLPPPEQWARVRSSVGLPA